MRPSRPASLFFDDFRTHLQRAPEGLHRLGAPATEGELATAERRLAMTLPSELRAFLSTWNGADLFHDSLVFAAAADLVRDDDWLRARGVTSSLQIAENGDGARFFLAAAAGATPVFERRADSPEPWLAGSSLTSFLSAAVAHEAPLYDDGGEFVEEAFEPDGNDLRPRFALRLAERAARKDPGSATFLFEFGLAQKRVDRIEEAAASLARAAELDPSNPWPWFELGRLLFDRAAAAAGLARADLAGESAAAFDRAAAAMAALPGNEGAPDARFLLFAARSIALAGPDEQRARFVTQALQRDPDLAQALARQAEAARQDEDHDPESLAETVELLGALSGQSVAVRRLPMFTPAPIKASAVPPAPPAAPPRPRPAPPRRPSPRRRGART